MDHLHERAIDLQEEYWWLMDRYDKALRDRKTVTMLVAGEMMDNAFKSLKDILHEINTIRHPQKQRESDVTPEMIRRAKEYPFQELAIFRHRYAMCPFHEGKTPALRLYDDNTVYCFACGKTWDTIQFFRELNGRSFVDAVRSLQ